MEDYVSSSSDLLRESVREQYRTSLLLLFPTSTGFFWSIREGVRESDSPNYRHVDHRWSGTILGTMGLGLYLASGTLSAGPPVTLFLEVLLSNS